MSDVDPNAEESENKLTSERYDEFTEALAVLYVPNNMGGRIAFIKKWPEAAVYVMGEELIHFDTEGTENPGDKEKRAELEERANENRFKLLDIARNLEGNSVHKGALQTEYVENLVKELGRDLALLLYSPRYVDRVIPPPPKEEGEEEGEADAAPEESQGADPAPVSEPVAQPQTEDSQAQPEKPIAETLEPIDDIQPISVEPPLAEKAVSPSAPAAESSSPVEADENTQDDDTPLPDGPVRFEDLKKMTEKKDGG